MLSAVGIQNGDDLQGKNAHTKKAAAHYQAAAVRFYPLKINLDQKDGSPPSGDFPFIQAHVPPQRQA